MKASATDNSLRKHLIYLLQDGGAHANFDAAVARFPPALRGTKPAGAEHTAWQLIEHLRIAQWDILEFSRNAAHVSPEFPAGYWPKTEAPPSGRAWNHSLRTFRADLQAMAELVKKPSTDLFAPIPHGNGQTVLREALLLADHNSYHLGQLIALRRLLNAWPA